jgi:epoxyqueuosine reductase
MSYLATDRAIHARRGPSGYVPDARSALVVACEYPSAFLFPEKPPRTCGRISAYACGADYHWIIPPILKIFITSLERCLGISMIAYPFVDTAPILERDFARSAGLGWIGKNSFLINPQIGSFNLLAVCFLNMDIEYTQESITDRCGTCTRCITACPTGCILPDRTIDARRCLSYLTIENKDFIPRGLRKFLGEWVFGCDICQMACPWNKKVVDINRNSLFPPNIDLAFPDLAMSLALTSKEFNEKYGKTPVKRAKRRGFLRNLAVASGCLKAEETIPALAEIMAQETEPLIRAHAAWALGSFDTQHTRQVLERALITEKDPNVLDEIRYAMIGDL